MQLEVGTFMPPHDVATMPADQLRQRWLDPEYVLRMNRAAERAGYDFVLSAYASSLHDPWGIAQYGADHTVRLRQLIAHRPGVMAPALTARMVSTLDVLTGGRIALNVISGGHQDDQERDGDFLEHDARYERTEEYLSLLDRIWTGNAPFDFTGRFYTVRKIDQWIRPLQRHRVPIYFGGASSAARRVAARRADVYMMWGEPRAGIKQRMQEMDALAAAEGRRLRYNVSFRTVIGETEAAAWSTVEQLMRDADFTWGARLAAESQSEGQRRLYEFAGRAEVLDERLYTGFARLIGGFGNSTALVGTRDQIVEGLLAYARMGVSSFTLRGFQENDSAPEFIGGLVRALRRAAADEPDPRCAAAPAAVESTPL